MTFKKKSKAIKGHKHKVQGFYTPALCERRGKMISPHLHSDDVSTDLSGWPFQCCRHSVLIVLEKGHIVESLKSHLSQLCFCYCIWLSVEFKVCKVCIVFLLRLTCHSIDIVTHLTAACKVMVYIQAAVAKVTKTDIESDHYLAT